MPSSGPCLWMIEFLSANSCVSSFPVPVLDGRLELEVSRRAVCRLGVRASMFDQLSVRTATTTAAATTTEAHAVKIRSYDS